MLALVYYNRLDPIYIFKITKLFAVTSTSPSIDYNQLIIKIPLSGIQVIPFLKKSVILIYF